MNDSVRRVRFGVLGSAAIARSAVMPAMITAQSADLVAVASRDIAKARSTADQFGAEAVEGYEQLLERDDIDAVYIPLPNHLHLPWTLRALAAGKHVLCEKPLALDEAEVQQIAESANRHNRVVMEAFMYPFHPLWDAISDEINRGTIGQITGLDSVFVFREDDPEHIAWKAEFGGGALLDVGCYLTHVARHLLGSGAAEPDSIQAESRIVTRGQLHDSVDASTVAYLRFGEATARIECSIDDSPESQHLHVIGSRGSLDVPTPFNPEADSPATFAVTSLDDEVRTVSAPPADNYRGMIEAFCHAILDGSDVPIPINDSIANAKLLDQIRIFSR